LPEPSWFFSVSAGIPRFTPLLSLCFRIMRFCFGYDFLVRVRHATLLDLWISGADLAFLLVDLVVSCLALHPEHDCVHSTDDAFFMMKLSSVPRSMIIIAHMAD